MLESRFTCLSRLVGRQARHDLEAPEDGIALIGFPGNWFALPTAAGSLTALRKGSTGCDPDIAGLEALRPHPLAKVVLHVFRVIKGLS